MHCGHDLAGETHILQKDILYEGCKGAARVGMMKFRNRGDPDIEDYVSNIGRGENAWRDRSLDVSAVPWEDIQDDPRERNFQKSGRVRKYRPGHKKRGGRYSPGAAFLITFLLVLLAGGMLLAVGCMTAGEETDLFAGAERSRWQEGIAAVAEEPIPERSRRSDDTDMTGATQSEQPDGSEQGGRGADDAQTALRTDGEGKGDAHRLSVTGTDGLVTFAFAGDILFDGNYAVGATAWNRGGIRACFDDAVWQVMQDADVFMLNNEFPYSTRGTPIAGKTYTFRASPDTAEWLSNMGVDLVSLGNNHAYDYGETALLDTLDTLDAMHMPHVGAGRNLTEAEEPAIFDCGGMKVGILCSTQIEQMDNPDTRGATEDSAGVFRCWDDTDLLRTIQETKQNCDIVMVYIHWGTEKEEKQSWWQTSRVQAMADAGADFIIGDHPHVLQGAEWCGNTFVFYSLGNFLFTSRDTDTGILEITLDSRTHETAQIRFQPLLQTNCTVTMMQEPDRTRVLNAIRDKSAGVRVEADGTLEKQ